MRLIIYKEVPVRVPRGKLKKLTGLISRGEGVTDDREAHVIFQSSLAQRKLNREYRSKDYDTDVLSFAYVPDERSPLLGEIYISVEKAVEQARELGHPLAQEIQRLFCHGLLHVLGYDHDRAETAKEMLAREERYLGGVNAG